MKITLISKGAVIRKAEVSAVFLIGFVGDKIVAARNERGQDIPGGHLEEGEEPIDGLRREAEEEAGVSFVDAIPYATLSLPHEEKCMLFFVSNSCILGDFTPKPDAFERDLLNIKTFIGRYYGDKDLMQELILKAQESLKVQ